MSHLHLSCLISGIPWQLQPASGLERAPHLSLTFKLLFPVSAPSLTDLKPNFSYVKQYAVSKWFKLLVSWFLEINRVQTMGMLLQINGAQSVWDPLLDLECKNLHELCLLAENL